MESLTSHTSRARFPVGGGTREGRAVVALDSVLMVSVTVTSPNP